MEIIEARAENEIILTVNGRVDTNTSAILQPAILNALQKRNYLILDFKNVDYISSAALRVLFIGQRTAESKSAKMVIKNVNNVVMDILEKSKFTDFLVIE